jgi:hypothetical protein
MDADGRSRWLNRLAVQVTSPRWFLRDEGVKLRETAADGA